MAAYEARLWWWAKFDLVSSLQFCYLFPMNIGIRLRELRKAKGFSQGDIEKRTGLLRCYTSRVENGHTVPNLETLEKFAGALGVELYQLFFTSEGQPQPVGSRDAGTLGPEERGLINAFKSLDKKDRKFLVAMARKMAKGNRPARQAASCLSGCFSKPQAVVYGRAAPSVSENLARVSVDVRYRRGLPKISG